MTSMGTNTQYVATEYSTDRKGAGHLNLYAQAYSIRRPVYVLIHHA